MSSAGTTHGTGYFYDERVPVLLFGAGIKPGKYWGAATPADLRRRSPRSTGITMARPDGRVLSEALAAPARHSAGADQRAALNRASHSPYPSPSRERGLFLISSHQRGQLRGWRVPVGARYRGVVGGGCGVIARGRGRPCGMRMRRPTPNSGPPTSREPMEVSTEARPKRMTPPTPIVSVK